MKLISHDLIMRLNISPYQCYEWVEEMLRNKDLALLPPKISMKQEGNIFYNVMPCIIPKYRIAGVKIVTRYPERTPSLDSKIMLYDLKTGNLKAIMDGNFITAMRTGAVAAHSIKLLAKKDYKTIGIIGLGNTARATFKVIMALEPLRPLTIKLYQYKNHADLFINKFKEYNNLTFQKCATYEEVIDKSDVIISCLTYTENNLCKDEFYQEGCLVVPIHTRGFQNCDLFFDKVYADDTEHVKGFKYFTRFKKFAEISDIIVGKAKGRENDEERIIVYNIGIAIHDIFFAEKIYHLADFHAVDNMIFDVPIEKFWV